MARLRTLGLLGGMSWESTAIYYRALNEGVRDRVGGLHSAPLRMWSCDFAEVAALQTAGQWAEAGAILADAARALEASGAEAIMICCNTMHEVAGAVAEATSVPLIHIADATGIALAAHGVRRPLLLGTRYTMDMAFISGPLATRFDLETTTPDEVDRTALHTLIYDELCQGVLTPVARAWLIALIEKGVANDADSVILGCTELGLLVRQGDVSVPLCDTATAHIVAALDFITADIPTKAAA